MAHDLTERRPLEGCGGSSACVFLCCWRGVPFSPPLPPLSVVLRALSQTGEKCSSVFFISLLCFVRSQTYGRQVRGGLGGVGESTGFAEKSDPTAKPTKVLGRRACSFCGVAGL